MYENDDAMMLCFSSQMEQFTDSVAVTVLENLTFIYGFWRRRWDTDL